MIHKNRGNRRWIRNKQIERKKHICDYKWNDGDTYYAFPGMYDKGKIHDEGTVYEKTNQKPFRGRGHGKRAGAHCMPKGHRMGGNWRAADLRKIESAESYLEEVENHRFDGREYSVQGCITLMKICDEEEKEFWEDARYDTEWV